MPPWGRPPGQGGRRDNRIPESMAWDDRHRFQELNSSNEGLGLIMDKTGFVSDELYFNDGRSRFNLPRDFDVTQYQVVEDSDEEEEEEEPNAIQVSGRDQQEHLVQRAMARIDRAKATGKPMVNFTHEEIEALEYRRANTSPERRSRAKKSSSNSPKRDHSNGAWSRKRHSSSRPKSGLFSTILAPPKNRSTGKSTRRRAPDESPPQDAYASGSYPPAIMIPGSNGAPVYSPLGYYNAYPPAQTVSRRAVTSPQAPPSVRTPSSTSRSTSNGQTPYDPSAPPYPVYARDYTQSQSSSRSSSLNHSVNLEQYGRSQSTPNVAPYRMPIDPRYVAQYAQPRRVISEPHYSSAAVSRGPSTRQPTSQRLYVDGAADEDESGSSGEEEDDEDSESEVEVIPVKRSRGATRRTK